MSLLFFLMEIVGGGRLLVVRCRGKLVVREEGWSKSDVNLFWVMVTEC